ncbi:MAG: hypothetical protein D6815_12160, partial [Candidatus Dadabacteria bacterium]
MKAGSIDEHGLAIALPRFGGQRVGAGIVHIADRKPAPAQAPSAGPATLQRLASGGPAPQAEVYGPPLPKWWPKRPAEQGEEAAEAAEDAEAYGPPLPKWWPNRPAEQGEQAAEAAEGAEVYGPPLPKWWSELCDQVQESAGDAAQASGGAVVGPDGVCDAKPHDGARLEQSVAAGPQVEHALPFDPVAAALARDRKPVSSREE